MGGIPLQKETLPLVGRLPHTASENGSQYAYPSDRGFEQDLSNFVRL